ncbi:MAG: hypothetical protein GY826_35850, partial [Fuerstiella sp.]|nr:hypothetical protein [Fuerstiella sp.]
MRPILSLCLLLNSLSGQPLISVSNGQETNSSGAESEILNLLLRNTPQPDYGAVVPPQISGRVLIRGSEGMSGAAGVSVTDGYSVVTTDTQGGYRLTPAADAVFIYMTRPAGHDVQGDWYKPLATSVDFELQAANTDEDEYIFVHVTDTHVSQNRRSLRGLSRFVREV